MVKVVIDKEQVRASLEGVKYLALRGRVQLLNELAAIQVRNITRRVRSGLGINDARYPQSKKIVNGKGGTTLVVTGNMLGSVRINKSAGGNSTEIIAGGSALEGKKWLWAQYGTRPHTIKPKGKRALAWRSSMSFANAIVGAGGKAQRFNQANARANSKGMVFARSVRHPGTPPRPAFGISPVDSRALQAHAEQFVQKWVGNLRRSA